MLWLILLSWLLVGLLLMHSLDACSGYTFTRYLWLRLNVSGWAIIYGLIVLWPLGLAGYVWWLFRKE